MEFFSSDRIDNFQGEKYRILVEVLGAMNIHPEAVMLTDASQVSDFLWEVGYTDGKTFNSYPEEFDYRFDQLVEKMVLMFDVSILYDNGCQKTIVDYVEEIYSCRVAGI
jgi:hypothetical protein